MFISFMNLGSQKDSMASDVPYLLDGWPIRTQNAIESSPVIADIDIDGDNELIVGSNDGYLYAWHHDERLVNNFPIFCDIVTSSPAVGDMDNDGDLEIVVEIYTGVGPGGNHFFVYHHDGTPVDGWPISSYWGAVSSPALGDLDGDGDMEIVFTSSGSGPMDQAEVHVYHHDGILLSGWPQLVMLNVIISSPAIADLDMDGDYEIIVGTGPSSSGGGLIYAWHHDGILVTGWSVSVDDRANFASSPIVGDIDGDIDVEMW